MCSGAVVNRVKAECVFLSVHVGGVGVEDGAMVTLHMCVFGELVLTQTQPLHCLTPSPVRMF